MKMVTFQGSRQANILLHQKIFFPIIFFPKPVIFVLIFLGVLFSTSAISQYNWQGPWPHSQGGQYWKGVTDQGAICWYWDNQAGLVTVIYDNNGDGVTDTWYEEMKADRAPTLTVYHWMSSQTGVENGIAWAEGKDYIEKVWDANSDGTMDSWCSYSSPGCVSWQSAEQCKLRQKQQEFQNKYTEYITASTSGDQAKIKWAYLQYQRAEMVFNVCKAIALRNSSGY